MPPVGNDEASGSPWISSLPENSAIAVPSPVGAVEGVVLLRGRAGQRLEPVRVVRRALLHRPFLHRLRDRVRQRRVERLAARERPLQRLVHVLGQPSALHGRREHVRSEDLVVGDRQVGRPERGSVGAPLRGGDILLAGPGHGLGRFLLEKLWGRAGSGERTKPHAIVVPSGPKGITQWRNRKPDLSTRGQTSRTTSDSRGSRGTAPLRPARCSG